MINKDIKVCDNFCDEEVFNNFCELLDSEDFTWSYDPSSVGDGDNFPQLVHLFFCAESLKPCSLWYDNVIDLIQESNIQTVGRIKLNGTFKEDKLKAKRFHRDFHWNIGDSDFSHLRIMILHLNTNNGYTLIKDTDDEIYRIKSVANRAIMFPNSYYHAGTNCTDEPLRKVLNVVYS